MRRALADLPLRQKIALVAIATMVAAQFLGGAGVLVWDLFAARRMLAEDLETQARIVVDNVSPALAFNDRDAADETLRPLRARRGFVRACLYDAHSRIFAAVTVNSECAETPAGGGSGFDATGIDVIVPVTAQEQGRVGTLTLRSSFAPVADAMRAQSIAIAGVMILSSLGAVFLTRRYHRMLTEPLHQLATTAQAVSRDRDYTRRVEYASGDEIGAVAEAFNVMMAQVQQRDAELQRALRLKDEFLATVSHELRTPLNAIVGWIHVFRAPDISPDLAAQAADAIDRNAQRQVRLIEDILDVSRIVTGKLRLEPRMVDLAKIVEAALDVIAPTAAAKDIAVAVDVAGPAPMRGDPDRLQQIMWNLLANAVKFTPRGGKVWVSLERERDSYRVAVRDSGPGIAPDFLPHMFEAFRQADGSMTRPHGGLGLGLAIAKHLTEMSGGQIEAESAGLGTGATFVLRLPRPLDDAARVAIAESPADTWPRLDGLNVLIVDDDEDTRQVLRTLLERQGAFTETAGSVAQAREALSRRVPDVVISDLAMPEEDGYSLLRYCRHHSLDGLRQVRVLALTAFAGEHIRDNVLRAGFDGYLSKPIDPGAVSRVIATTASSVRR